MKISKKGLDLIKSFEGYSSIAYICPAGVWTIGYGTTKNVRAGQVITETTAEKFLAEDVAEFEKAVLRLVKVKMTQSIFDALVSFTYNVGSGALDESTLLKLLNQKQYAASADQMLRWDKAGNTRLEGLTRRRQAERKLFYSEKFPI